MTPGASGKPRPLVIAPAAASRAFLASVLNLRLVNINPAKQTTYDIRRLAAVPPLYTFTRRGGAAGFAPHLRPYRAGEVVLALGRLAGCRWAGRVAAADSPSGRVLGYKIFPWISLGAGARCQLSPSLKTQITA